MHPPPGGVLVAFAVMGVLGNRDSRFSNELLTVGEIQVRNNIACGVGGGLFRLLSRSASNHLQKSMNDEELPVPSKQAMAVPASQPAHDVSSLVREAEGLSTRPVEVHLVRRLFPDKVEKARRKGELDMVRAEMERKQDEFEKICKTRVRALEENLNAYLITLGAGLRAEVAGRVTRILAELITDADKLREVFYRRMDESFTRAASYKTPAIREAEYASLNLELNKFQETWGILLAKFANIVNETITTPATKSNP